MSKTNCRDHGVAIGDMTPGPTNSLADVCGLSFGHVTLRAGAIQTGVSVIHPVPDDIFTLKCPAASHVINGFGKSVGLMQLDELGQLETPIVLTNTLSVGTASTALVRFMLSHHGAIGETTGTVNPVVLECNDGAYLNDIRGLHVKEQDVLDALAQHLPACPQGAVGAGTGMSCYQLKGGVGSSSRLVPVDGHSFTLGAFALCNMGLLEDLLVQAEPIGRRIAAMDAPIAQESERGSVILVLATDAPLTSRQLKRLCVRAGVGLARTGTHFGSGSGDIVVAFSTANRIPHDMPPNPVLPHAMLHEDCLDAFFRATIESVEEAILNALFASQTSVGKQGRTRTGLADLWPLLHPER